MVSEGMLSDALPAASQATMTRAAADAGQLPENIY